MKCPPAWRCAELATTPLCKTQNQPAAGIAAEKLALASLFGPSPLAWLPGGPSSSAADDLRALSTREEWGRRRHVVTVGNWLHAPNMDACAWMAEEIWCGIRGRIFLG